MEQFFDIPDVPLATVAVGTIMRQPAELIAPDTSLGEAARLMDQLQSSSLLVAQEGEMVGILTLHDVVAAFCSAHGPGEAVREFMSCELITVRDSDSLEGAARLMVECRIHHLPVLDVHGKLVGIAHSNDFRRHFAVAIKEQATYAKRLDKALEATLMAMASVLEHRDPYTADHQQHVAVLAVLIGRELGFDEERLRALNLAAIVHDLGKIQVPIEILTKPARLSPTEFALVKQHPLVSYNILKTIDFPWPIADIVVQHHEYLDGSGYPYGLKGEQILPEARVLTVADIVESMSSDRPYRAALGIDVAIAEITRLRDSKLDAEVVDACVRVLRRGEFAPNLLQLE